MATLIMGCGYLGQVLGQQLASRGERVIGTVRSAERAAKLAEIGIEARIADVLKPESLANLPETERTVYCVGFDRSSGASMRSVYVQGLRSFLAHRGTVPGKLIYVSSTGVYGQTDGSWVTEDSPTEPTHESGRVCLDAEREALAGDRDSVILRFAGLYGPGRIVRRESLLRNAPIVGDPAKFLNLVHIEDAARAIAVALENPQSNGCYLVSDARPVTRKEYYELAAECLGAPPPRFEAPSPDSAEAQRDASNKRVSNRRIRQELGLELKYPEIRLGLPAALAE